MSNPPEPSQPPAPPSSNPPPPSKRPLRRLVIISAIVLALAAAYYFLAVRRAPESAAKLFDQRKDGEAEKALLARLAVKPDDAEALVLLGRIDYNHRRYEEASKRFEAAIKIEPKRSDYMLWYGRSWGRQAGEAPLLRQPSLAMKAREQFERAVELDPKNREARLTLLEFCARAPAMMGGGKDKARAQAAELEKLDASDGHRGLAIIAQASRDYKTSEAEYRAAAAARPNDADIWTYYGRMLREAKRPVDAVDPLERAIKLDPKLPLPRIELAGALCDAGLDPAKVEEHANAFLALPPVGDDPPPEEANRLLAMIGKAK